MRSSSSRLLVTLLVLVLGGSVAAPVAAAPEGTMTWAVHITLASRWLDPAETEGIITPFMVLYALHDALVKPMPAGINTPSLAESWTQSKDGLTYEFVLRKGVKFHNGEPVTAADVKFSFERYRGAGAKLLKERVREVQIVGPGPRALRPQGAVAGLHDVLRDLRHRRRLDRAQGLRREGRRRRLQAGADRRRPLQVRELQPRRSSWCWRRSRATGARSPTSSGWSCAACPTRRRAPPRSRRARWTSPISERPRGRGRPAHAGLQAGRAQGVAGGPSGSTCPTSGTRSRPGTTGACGRPRATPSTGKALNQAETLGFSYPTGSLIPRALEFSRFFEPDRLRSARAKRLLAEAGYPNGFDAGDLYPWPPYFSMGEALAGYLQSGRHPDQDPHHGARGHDDGVAREEAQERDRGHHRRGRQRRHAARAPTSARTASTPPACIPEVEDLFQRQARETDVKKREALSTRSSGILHERVTHIPIYELAFIWGVGPRVEEPGINLIRSFAYSAPLEDLRLKRP